MTASLFIVNTASCYTSRHGLVEDLVYMCRSVQVILTASAGEPRIGNGFGVEAEAMSLYYSQQRQIVNVSAWLFRFNESVARSRRVLYSCVQKIFRLLKPLK